MINRLMVARPSLGIGHFVKLTQQPWIPNVYFHFLMFTASVCRAVDSEDLAVPAEREPDLS